MEISSYLYSKSLNIDDLSNSLEQYSLSAKEAINEGRENFFKVILETDKTKQALLGQYHTTEEQVELVLQALPSSFVDNVISGSRVIDPSCGVGNFLIKVVHKALLALHRNGLSKEQSHKYVNEKIIPNLHGIEVDPSLSQSVSTLFDFEFDGKIESPKIHLFDALFSNSIAANELIGNFDYVIGNPPWVEVKKLPDEIKNNIQTTFNVSNLYGAFIIDSKKFLKPLGHLSFVVPRSFTGGKYYSKLRDFLNNEVSLKKIFYFNNRNLKFHGGKVLQEIVVLSYQNTPSDESSAVECIPNFSFEKLNKEKRFNVYKKEIFSRHDNIMLLPEDQEELSWLNSVLSFKNFEEHGIRFSTGQLVTHRAKDFMRDHQSEDTHRVLYAHDIINNSQSFEYRKLPSNSKAAFATLEGIRNFDGRNKEEKNKVEKNKASSIKNWLNDFRPIIIMRRRSHKGDKRRFVGVYLEKDLPNQYFLDNSLNFICYSRLAKNTAPTLKSFYKILCSDVFERFFSVISSNTQINKNDMFLFGLPDKNERTKKLYSEIENTDTTDKIKLNRIVYKLYEQSNI